MLKSLPGVDKAEFGTILSFGYMTYAAGKVVSGILIDRYGGAPIFVGGLVLSLVASTVFLLLPVAYDPVTHQVLDPTRVLSTFGFVWCINRAAQSAGWGALVKTIYQWFPQSMHGRVLGLASLSYGLGDVLIRIFLGSILSGVADPVAMRTDPGSAGHAWRTVFVVSIVCTIFLVMPSFRWFKSLPEHVPELEYVNVDELYSNNDPGSLEASGKEKANRKQSVHIGDVLRVLLSNPKFYTLAVMSPCLTLIRETFISWTAVFLSDTLDLKDGDAAMLSMLFPLFGTFSSLLGGIAVDRASPHRRGLIPPACLLALTVMLMGTAMYIPEGADANAGSVFGMCCLLSGISLALMAPFSFVDGLFVLSLTGKHGAGLAVGIINCIGYMGATLAGHEMGFLAEKFGWHYVLSVLAGVSTLTFFASLVYWHLDVRELDGRPSASGGGIYAHAHATISTSTSSTSTSTSWQTLNTSDDKNNKDGSRGVDILSSARV